MVWVEYQSVVIHSSVGLPPTGTDHQARTARKLVVVVRTWVSRAPATGMAALLSASVE